MLKRFIQLTVCLLVASLPLASVDATVGGPPTCSTVIYNNPGLVSDCEVLLSARDTLAGDATLNWSAAVGMNAWDGITLSGTPPRVTEVDLSFFDYDPESDEPEWGTLNGTIPPELGSLTKLEQLDLFANDLSGPIPPELANLTNLEELDLGHNGAVGPGLSGPIPPGLANLTNLDHLNLGYNGLNGTIPPELGKLTNLERLDLGPNDLSGSIPPELGNLTNLEVLALNSTELSGPIPPELSNLTNLWLLRLNHNALSGSIPPELSNLANLETLDLRSNELSGPIPRKLVELSNLDSLVLNNNALSGSIPPELGNLALLDYLDLGYNALSGPIPPELGNLTRMKALHLEYNALSGSIPPELGSLTDLQSLYLNNNALSGPIPPGLSDLPDLTLDWVDLSGNDLCIPASHQNEPLFRALDYPICDDAEPTLTITVSPDTTVAYTEEVTLTAHVPESWQVDSYRWAHVGGSPNLGNSASLTLGGERWPHGPGTRTFRVIVTLIDGREATAEQAITFTEPPLPPLPPPLPEVMITVSPSTTVSYTEEVTLTAHVLELDPLQVASYRWAHIGGSQNLSTSQSVTLGGAKWPYGPGVRRFRVFVGFTNGRQVIAEQGIMFTEPPSQGVSVSITVSPGTTVAHTEEVTLTAHVSDPSQVASYRWAHVGGYYKIGTQQSVTLGGSGWPHGPGTRTFQVIVTLTDETTTAAAQSITFTNP